MVLEKPQFDPKGPPSAPLHQIDADDDNAKQLKECSSLYLALQDCVNTNRNWKSCQSDFESVEMTQDGMNNTGAPSYPRALAVLALNETNHKQWVESITMNLTFMKVDLALRIDAPSKPTDDATEKDKKFYEDWEHSNRCCLMLMRYHMNESIRDSIPKSENAKDFLAVIKEKYQRFSKNEKNEHLNILHHTIYDGSSDIRVHIDKLMGYYHKLKAMGMDLGEDYIVWLVMETIPSQFDAIRSSYNAQKKQWTVGEMSSILAKEEEDMGKK
ncbi:uncharacterized protein LOC133822385 isoform X1 [Humulus lupulus]|uniref:uncharacterized protein LOC133822385 isoform X1 n=1 Tax=Humulus lupulus TaxID=3486 RepID=UPI002B4158C7|nr:uncharacterized protein LOC133822385 isoform X1 [Humulus lupulus]